MSLDERDNMRQVFFDAWKKHLEKKLLEPIEAQIVKIILQHPEYHAFFTQPPNGVEGGTEGENPFLHISLHLALYEQITTDRPPGIKEIYAKICSRLQDTLLAEHKMIECLASVLWDAQTLGKMPDERAYLEMLRRI